MRPQEHHFGLDGARTQSPIDYDTPAARGNREYERLYGNTGYQAGMAIPSGMDRVGPILQPGTDPTFVTLCRS
jgi:hypothetical protein